MKILAITTALLAILATTVSGATKKPTKKPTSAPTVTPTAAPTAAPTSSASSVKLHPSLPSQTCTKSGCTTEQTSIVLDAKESPTTNENDYAGYGVHVKGDSLILTLKDGKGPRVYLTATDDKYKMFKMVGKEFTYDVDTSLLDCDMNGALYFVQMPENGARNGTGYCDANGVGGSNCEEMDIWEANRYANALTTHATAYDSSGCGLNPYKKGNKNLYGYGSGFSVDTSKKFSVVTQFIDKGTGVVSEIRRMYLQDGKVIFGGSLKESCKVAEMGAVMKPGSVLAMSVWWSTGMGWLDSGDAGPCPTGGHGKDATVTFSNIRYGDIGTTAKGTDTTPAPTAPPPPAPKWGQCGGADWDGTTSCAEGTCVKMSEYYSQCQ